MIPYAGALQCKALVAFISRCSSAGARSAKVTANVFNAGLHRIVHHAGPVPPGSNRVGQTPILILMSLAASRGPHLTIPIRSLASSDVDDHGKDG